VAPFWAAARRAVVPREVGRAVLRVEARAVLRVEARAVLCDADLVAPGDEVRDVLRDAGEAGALVPADLVPADLDELELDGLELVRLALARVELVRLALVRLALARVAPARVAPARLAPACVAGDRVADARLAVDRGADARLAVEPAADARLAEARLAVDRLAVEPAAPDRPVVAWPAVLLLVARVRAGLESAALPLAAPVPVAFAAADLLAVVLLPDALLGGCVMGFCPFLHRDPDGPGVRTARVGRRPYPTNSGRRPCTSHHPPGMTTIPAPASESA
jgi:hypothetical protein